MNEAFGTHDDIARDEGRLSLENDRMWPTIVVDATYPSAEHSMLMVSRLLQVASAQHPGGTSATITIPSCSKQAARTMYFCSGREADADGQAAAIITRSHKNKG